jgi:DNA mismatch repair protein MutS2
MIDKHTLSTLEYPRVIERLRGKCLTPYGGEAVNAISPMFDRNAIERRLTEVSHMKDIIRFGLPFPLTRMDDVREWLVESKVPGGLLEPKEILAVMHLAVDSAALAGWDKDGRSKYPSIDAHLLRLRSFPEMIASIRKAVDENGEIKDSASPTLRRVRLELTETRRKILQKLDTILSGQKKQEGWQDDVVTMRNGRYVISIPSSQYRSDTGILHDRSGSGATLFVEPKEAVEINNRLHVLSDEEHTEIERILRSLTADISERADAMTENTRIIGQIDMLNACARMSIETGGNAPRISNTTELTLAEARHPLLIYSLGGIEKVIPTTLTLSNDRPAILITGPNTGGKTITLKTVGICVLMAQSGLHISAGELSQIGVFTNIFADIGDEQSIELSLSTFSSHIRNIVEGIRNVGANTLLLFDEIGAGTDPREGAALAESIVLYAVKQGARLIATTHYSQLKTLASEHAEIENASLEFDRATLSPNYNLRIGLPGSSYAVEIAERLGLPQEICRHAAELVGTSERSVADLVSDLEEQLKQVRNDRGALSERLQKAETLETHLRLKSESLSRDIEAEKKRALEETQEFVDQTRREMERLVAEIRTSQASAESVKQFQKTVRSKDTETQARREQMSAKSATERLAVGDRVMILSLNAPGEIEAMIGKDRARVKTGNVVTTVEVRNLKRTDATLPKPLPRVSRGAQSESSAEREIHLRGMTVEEAMAALERFIDRSVVAGLHQIYVIHGKGTGVLRTQLTNYLKGHAEVASLRLGDWNEGGAGVTIVTLKE